MRKHESPTTACSRIAHPRERGFANGEAGTLGMMAGGAIDVNTATNNVTTLGASTSSGTIKYQDADALTLANVAVAQNPGGFGAQGGKGMCSK